MQRVSFSRAHLALPLTECDCFAKCRRRVPAEHKLSELKVHRTRERRELFTCGFHGDTTTGGGRVPVKEPMEDDGRCAISMFLAVGGDSVTFPSTPRTMKALNTRHGLLQRVQYLHQDCTRLRPLPTTCPSQHARRAPRESSSWPAPARAPRPRPCPRLRHSPIAHHIRTRACSHARTQC